MIKTTPDNSDVQVSSTHLYYSWRNMRNRCNNPNTINFKYYGAKGIKVCDEWNNDFWEFYKYVKTLKNYEKYKTDNYSLDRIDNSKGYEIGNVRWVSKRTQVINRTHYNTNLGYTGIRFNEKCSENPYSARVYIEGKEKTVGYFKTLQEAVEKRNTYIEQNGLPNKKQEFKVK